MCLKDIKVSPWYEIIFNNISYFCYKDCLAVFDLAGYSKYIHLKHKEI